MMLLHGDCLDLLPTLAADSVQCCVTSPPYFGLRDYGTPDQIGLEPTPAEYVARLVAVFRDVRRVLTDDGTLWLNLGDSYASETKGSGGAGKSTLGPNRDLQNIDFQKMAPRKFSTGLASKQLLGIPWRVAFALQADGWYLRSDIIWHKPNCMPESVKDRPTKSHEYLFLLAKSATYYYDAEAIYEDATTNLVSRILPRGSQGYATASGGPSGNSQRGHVNGYGYNAKGKRNKRTVWTIPTKPYSGAHFAVMPEALVEPCILAGSRPGDTILDPFAGSGTVGAVAVRTGRDFIGCDLNADYLALAERRIAAAQPPLFQEVAD